MSEWKRYKLSDLYEMSSGISSTKEQAGHGSTFLSFSVVFNNYFLPDSLIDLMDTTDGDKQKYSINEGDIFLTRTSETVDELAMSSVALKDYPEASFSGFLKRLRPVDKRIVYPKFMAFYLRSPLFRRTIINNTVMTLRASFNEAMFSYLEIMLPDFDTQKKIGDFLYSLEKKKQTNNQINQELEAMAKTLYDYWFVQFDFPDQDGKPYKSSGGKMVYNLELKREIPEGWEVEKLFSLLEIGRETINPMKTPKEEFKYYSIPEFDTKGTYSLERGESIKSNKFKVEKNDLLVSKLNPWFNRVIYNLEENAISSTEFIVWKTFDRFEKNFLYQVATSEGFIEYCTRFATGTSNSHKRVSPDIMVGFQIPFEKTYIQKFGEITDSIRTQVLQNNEQNQELTQLRDWLLPMLMSGQVKVE